VRRTGLGAKGIYYRPWSAPLRSTEIRDRTLSRGNANIYMGARERGGQHADSILSHLCVTQRPSAAEGSSAPKVAKACARTSIRSEPLLAGDHARRHRRVERELIRDRSSRRRAWAKVNGVHFGRKGAYSCDAPGLVAGEELRRAPATAPSTARRGGRGRQMGGGAGPGLLLESVRTL
jgi:hypothetical protein